MAFRKVTSSPVFPRLAVAAAAVAILYANPLQAQKLYKIVDEDGKVSYQDTPPVEDAKVESKYASPKGMHLRETAPADGSADAGLDLLNENGEDVVEEDAPDLVPNEGTGFTSPDIRLNADEDGPLPSGIQEIPAHRRKDAIGDFRRTREAIDENGGVIPRRSTKVKVVPQKRKRLTQEELNDIARSANQ